MEEDFAIEILLLYKQHQTLDRDTAFSILEENTLNVSRPQFDQLIHTFLERNFLMESGTPNTYIYWPKAEPFLQKLQQKKNERDRIRKRKERTENRKDWKERNWALIGLGSFIGGVLSTLVVTDITIALQKNTQTSPKSDSTSLHSDTSHIIYRSLPKSDNLPTVKKDTSK